MLPQLKEPMVKAAIVALQNGDVKGWNRLFEPDATLLDDGQPRDLKRFSREALGHERFLSIDKVSSDGSLSRESFNPIGGVAFGPTFVSPSPQKERYASLRSVRSDHAFEGGTSKSTRRVPSKCVPVLQRLFEPAEGK
jgi:hypothetical protein